MAEMLSKMKTLLIDVLLEKCLPDGSRIKLKDCISMVESFSNFLNNIKKQEQNSDNFLKPLHSGLSRSTECLHVNEKKNKMPKSRSASDIANFDLYDNDSDGEVDLNNLKESYLQAVNELNNNNSEISEQVNEAKINNTKPAINSDKTETNQANPDVNAIQNHISNPNNEKNDAKAPINDVETVVNGSDPEVNGTGADVHERKTKVVKREDKGSRPRRKRDSSTLFDISLDDLTEPDHSGFLVEKHSGKEWWCVLQDQHLCMFPSQNPQELAYDVLLVPCCEISLDDVYTESPVFRLTQVGSTPWVFSAGIERNLRAWIRALYRACGRDDADWSMRGSKKNRGRKNQKRNMKVLTSTIAESEEIEDEQINGATVDEEKTLENGITAKKETGNQQDFKNDDEIKVLEENGKVELKEVGQDVEHKSGSGIDKEKEINEDITSQGIEREVEHENGFEKWEERKDGISMKENNETNMDDSGKQSPSDNIHQTISEDCLTTKEGNELSENEEELPTTLADPEVNRTENGNGNLNKAKNDQRQDRNGIFKEINESKSSELKDDKQENDSENKNSTCLPTIAFDDDHSDYVIRAESAEQMSDSQTEGRETAQGRSMERRATKKRIKMLRWLKKAIVDKGQDDVTVIGDIYKIEGANNQVKLWCLLRDRQLYCYRRVTDTKPDSVIALDNCIAVPSDCTFGQKYAFHIEQDGTKLATFAARRSKERARWIEIVKKKRGKYPLMEIGQESEEDSTGSETSSEEDDDDSHEYVEVDDVKSATNSNTEPIYDLAMSDYEDAGYISVLALECEIDRRRSCRKEKKYNPNITNKCTIERLAEMDKPLLLSTLPKDMSVPIKRRSPAPLPKVLLNKIQGELSKSVPALHLENDGEREPGDGVDLNNNTDIDSLEKESFSGECADDGEILSFEHQGILHCQLTASSWLPDSPPCQARLGLRPNGSEKAPGAWRPEKNDKTQFLEIDLGDVVTVGAITIMGRPDFHEKRGEFVKSFTLHYSIDKETWTPYKSHGKLKIFQGMSSATQECKKYLKNKTSAQYFRIYPQSWQNHIALRVALYKDDVKSKGMKKKGDKSRPTSPLGDHPHSPPMRRKIQLTKEDISDPMYPSSDCLITEVCDIKENCPKNPNIIETSLDCSDNPASMESRIQLREKLLSKEKREQITKLSVLKQHVDQAKDRMIVVNTSGQLKREAIESEHDYLVANLELVKAKKRLIDIETEMRELRLFGEKYTGEQQESQEAENPEEIAKPANEAKSTVEAKTTEVPGITEAVRRPKPPLKRRPSKEVMMYSDAVSPQVDHEGFNSPGDPPPPRKVMDNVKLFEKLQKIP